MSSARGDSLLWFRLSGFHSTDGWKSIGRVFVLALVPYLILRGLVNRWGAKRMNLTDTSDPRSVVLPPAFLQLQRTKHSM